MFSDSGNPEIRRLDNEIDSAVREKQKANPVMGYTEAFRLVASEKPELVRQRGKLLMKQIRP